MGTRGLRRQYRGVRGRGGCVGVRWRGYEAGGGGGCVCVWGTYGDGGMGYLGVRGGWWRWWEGFDRGGAVEGGTSWGGGGVGGVSWVVYMGLGWGTCGK